MTGEDSGSGMERTPSDAGAATKSPATPPPRRRTLVLAAVAAVAVLVLVVLLQVLGGDDMSAAPAGSQATSSATAQATTPTGASPPPTPAPTGPTSNVDELPVARPEVPLDAQAAVGNGIVAAIPRIDAIQGTAVGRGSIAGPALRVTIRIVNGTGAPVSLDGVAVNMSYGPDDVPASPLADSSQRPFAGTVPPGDTANGVYVFQVPADERSPVTVEVGYQAGAPLLLFTGPVD
jgi:hypothetical protein